MTDPSLFDPQSFLDATTTEAATRRPPLPAGLELPGTITDIAARRWTSQKDPNNPRSGIAFDVKVQVQTPPDLVANQGYPPNVTYNDSVMLDLTDGGSIDYAPGRNGRLRLYREATGTNDPGREFTPRMLVGKSVKVKIAHRPGTGQFSGELFDEIGTISKP